MKNMTPYETTAPASSTKSIKVVIDAFASNEDGDSPSYVVFDVDQPFLERLVELVAVCDEHGLTEARIAKYPDWGPGNIEEQLRLTNGELVVLRGGSFWFTDQPKHYDYSVSSRAETVSALKTAFDAAASGEVVFLTDDEDIREQYAEDIASKENPDSPSEKG